MREALVAARNALDECRSQAHGLSADELASYVEKVNALMQHLAAVQLKLIREVDARGLAVNDGATSTAAWLRDRYRISDAAASRLVRLARALDIEARSPAAEKVFRPARRASSRRR
jgi:nitric oxide synthase oxygenase domain/subunit